MGHKKDRDVVFEYGETRYNSFIYQGEKVRFQSKNRACFQKEDIARVIKVGDVYTMIYTQFDKTTQQTLKKEEDVRVEVKHNNWYELKAVKDGYRFTATLGDLLVESSLGRELLRELSKFHIEEKYSKYK